MFRHTHVYYVCHVVGWACSWSLTELTHSSMFLGTPVMMSPVNKQWHARVLSFPESPPDIQIILLCLLYGVSISVFLCNLGNLSIAGQHKDVCRVAQCCPTPHHMFECCASNHLRILVGWIYSCLIGRMCATWLQNVAKIPTLVAFPYSIQNIYIHIPLCFHSLLVDRPLYGCVLLKSSCLRSFPFLLIKSHCWNSHLVG